MKKTSLALLSLLALSATVTHAAPASEIWTNQCAKCHGADGAGKTKIGAKLKLKDYTDASVQSAMSDEEISKAIKNGVTVDGKEKMKAFSDLPDDDVQALVAHVRAYKK